MDIYGWRVLCHTAGDGSVKYHRTTRALPEINWAQKTKNQENMLKLLKRWNPFVKNSGMNIKYPKALTYTIIGCMLGITFRDLRSPKFVQFVLNLPLSYRDRKVQFLATFLIDDGTVGKIVQFAQKNKTKLEYVMKLCDQLGYEHSPYPPKFAINRIYRFQLRANGTKKFYNDLKKVISKDPLLGLWHKQHRLEERLSSYSGKNIQAFKVSKKVYITILAILGDHKSRTNRQLRNHPTLSSLVSEKSRKWFEIRTRKLYKWGLIQETKQSNYRKYWGLLSGKTSAELIQEFLTNYHAKRQKI
jgi:hypothetical protein